MVMQPHGGMVGPSWYESRTYGAHAKFKSDVG